MKRYVAMVSGTLAAVAALAIGAGGAGAQSASAELPAVVKDGKIGYVLTHRYWAVHQTPEGKVEARVVQASRTIGDQWLVDAGLAAGDRVIVEGLQKVQPGGNAKAVEAGAAPQEPSAPADAGGDAE